MKLRTLALSAATALTLIMTGCSTNPTSAQVGTGVGAVAGGVWSAMPCSVARWAP